MTEREGTAAAMGSKIHLLKSESGDEARGRKGRWLHASRIHITQTLFETLWLMEHLLPPPGTAAPAQGISSFPADRKPLPPRTSREKDFLKQNVWQSNSFWAYWGLYFYISLFSSSIFPSVSKRAFQPQDFVRISGGGWACPLL